MIFSKKSELEAIEKKSAALERMEIEFAKKAEYNSIHSILIDRICPNPSQPRKVFDDDALLRLADSIRQYGILQPLSVRRLTSDSSPSGALFELVAGERRLRASKVLGLREVPCIIVDADNHTSAELAIIENIQREDLNMFEQASAIALLIDIYDLTQEQVARRLSTSQSCVANKLRILRLTPKERELILRLGLSERHARALLKLDTPDMRIKAIERIASKKLNVAAAEEYIDKMLVDDKLLVENTVDLSTDADKTSSAEKQKRKMVLKDIRVFYNTIDRAVEIVQAAGIPVKTDKREEKDGVTYIISIPNGAA